MSADHAKALEYLLKLHLLAKQLLACVQHDACIASVCRSGGKETVNAIERRASVEAARNLRQFACLNSNTEGAASTMATRRALRTAQHIWDRAADVSDAEWRSPAWLAATELVEEIEVAISAVMSGNAIASGNVVPMRRGPRARTGDAP